MWEGERGELMAALESTGFIDREPTGLVIHDWYSYWGKYDDRKRANADRTRAYRERLKAATSEPRDAHVIDTQRARDGATEQDNTEQEIDKPAGKIKSLDSARAREISESFDVFWAAYPRKAGK